MEVSNKYRFPHHYNLMKLGGTETVEGEKYHNQYYLELNEESEFVLENAVERFRFGGNKKSHDNGSIEQI